MAPYTLNKLCIYVYMTYLWSFFCLRRIYEKNFKFHSAKIMKNGTKFFLFSFVKTKVIKMDDCACHDAKTDNSSKQSQSHSFVFFIFWHVIFQVLSQAYFISYETFIFKATVQSFGCQRQRWQRIFYPSKMLSCTQNNRNFFFRTQHTMHIRLIKCNTDTINGVSLRSIK